ncbi:DUF5406 domain-containing protein [Photobacterium damselae subsp. damselae]|uniref:DUF5406 domain-containing protein n=1 Tax=Photobacterium damselae TaxID=38293 RepID=UPI001F188A77|nr:DUF5406 domain-containing protein [Photobacterium damselae]UJZ95021.1 DUF5406 domain-containing protein [Photobacterium damselae subsp. damselae]UJZ99002.1 DUF5406 domain-containing protein [Photobacterium damselae subsp. damselae]
MTTKPNLYYDQYHEHTDNVTHVIEIIVQQWEYKKVFIIDVIGNKYGAFSLKKAISNLYTTLTNGSNYSEFDLKSDDGEILGVEISNYHDLSEMIVGIKIVNLQIKPILTKENKND